MRDEDEAVAGVGLNVQVDLVGDLGGCADELLTAGHRNHQLTDAEVLGLCALPPAGGDGLRVAVPSPALGDGRVVGRFDVGQRPLGVVAGKVALPYLFEHRDSGLRTDLLATDMAGRLGGSGPGLPPAQ